jgi:hypothetical protein
MHVRIAGQDSISGAAAAGESTRDTANAAAFSPSYRAHFKSFDIRLMIVDF